MSQADSSFSLGLIYLEATIASGLGERPLPTQGISACSSPELLAMDPYDLSTAHCRYDWL